MNNSTYRKHFYLILWFFLGQNLNAIISLQNYWIILYKSLGLAGKMSLILVGVWGTTMLIISLFGAYFFDKLERRINFFISLGGVIIENVMLVVFWARYEASGNMNKTLGNSDMFAIFFFLAGYG